MRTKWPCHRRSRRVAPLTAVRVGEATHPSPVYTKHLRCPHCPQRLFMESHPALPRAPKPTSFPVMGEWSFSEADAVEEGRRRRQRGPRSREARQRRLGRGVPNTIGQRRVHHPAFKRSGFHLAVAELSARFRLMVSKPSVLCLTETWADKGFPSMRIEGCTLISRRDRADGRQGGGVAVFALSDLLIGSPLRIPRLRTQLGDETLTMGRT